MNVIAERKDKTIYQDGDKAYKVFNRGFSKSDIFNEATNQVSVEEIGLNVPKVLEVTKVDGKWAIVTEFIEGKTLDQLMEENPEKEAEYLSMFVDLQMKMHEKECASLKKLKDKMHAKISESNFSATVRYELHSHLDAMPNHEKVCHGDFNPSNVIVTPEGVPYILDWSHATKGNASGDVARTYLLFKLKGQDDLAEKYLTMFCGWSDTAMQYVRKWMPIVAASQSVKGNMEEREFLTDWVNVVEIKTLKY